MDYTLTAFNITDSTADISVLYFDETPVVGVDITVDRADGTGRTFIEATGAGGIAHFTDLDDATTYVASLSSGEAQAEDIEFTTKAVGYDTPKVATQEQWEDLASRVKAKANVGTVLSQPNDVAYVGAANIIDGSVGKNKIDWSTIEEFTNSLSLDNAAIKTGSFNLKAVRFGKIVTLWGGFTVTNASAYTDLITIPEGYRPPSHTQVKVRSSDLILDIRSDGRIQCHTAISASTDFYLAITYVATN